MSLTKCGVHLADFLKIGLEFVLVSLQVRFQIMISVSSEEDICPAKPRFGLAWLPVVCEKCPAKPPTLT